MKAPLAPQPTTLPLHAVWWTVLKPSVVVLANGQPTMEAVHSCETLAEATMHVSKIPGGTLVANVVVFVNPSATALIKPN